jgi:hypothetical protein
MYKYPVILAILIVTALTLLLHSLRDDKDGGNNND